MSYCILVQPAAQVGVVAPDPAPVAVVVSANTSVTTALAPAVVFPTDLRVTSANETLVASRVPAVTAAIVSSCSTSNPSAKPDKCKLAKIPLVPLLNFKASFSG